VGTRILHVSDLHVGAGELPASETMLATLVERTGPDLVVASGDLTHRGRPGQHAAAAALLLGLGPPVLAVPGNHDIPYTFPARIASPWREFERHWATTEPVHATQVLHVVGANSVRPWRHQSGALGEDALARVAARVADAAPGAVRVVVLHHQLIGAPWRTRKRPLARRGDVLARLADAGADLIVGGHIHQATVSERREFEVLAGGARGVVVATAPGLGRPRPHRRGEARGALLYSIDDTTIRVETSIWRDGAWSAVATREFSR